MSKMTARLFIYIAVAALLVSCGSKLFRPRGGQGSVQGVVYPFAARDERQAVLPHLHYSVDMRTLDKERGLVELSFFFLKEQGDSLLWVECVEKVPIASVDTANCSRLARSGW